MFNQMKPVKDDLFNTMLGRTRAPELMAQPMAQPEPTPQAAYSPQPQAGAVAPPPFELPAAPMPSGPRMPPMTTRFGYSGGGYLGNLLGDARRPASTAGAGGSGAANPAAAVR